MDDLAKSAVLVWMKTPEQFVKQCTKNINIHLVTRSFTDVGAAYIAGLIIWPGVVIHDVE